MVRIYSDKYQPCSEAGCLGGVTWGGLTSIPVNRGFLCFSELTIIEPRNRAGGEKDKGANIAPFMH